MRVFLFSLLFLLPSAALAAPLPAVQEICTCTYQNVATTMVFTDIAAQGTPMITSYVNTWVPAGGSASDATCTTHCNQFLNISNPPRVLVSAEYTHQEPERAPILPTLNVQIPGLTFQTPVLSGNQKIITFLGDYIQAIYRYLIGAGAVFAIIMIIVGGVQYMLKGGAGDVKEAKERITNALIGFGLLLGSFTLLQLTNPQLTFLRPLKLIVPPKGDEELLVDENPTETAGATASNCQESFDSALAGLCPLQGVFVSPTNKSYQCNYHFRNANYDVAQIKALDFQGSWNDQIVAPGEGSVKFVKGSAANRCGNSIKIFMKNGGTAVICHAKDFVGQDGREVKEGEVIGHIGGRCCTGEKKPSGGAWAKASISGTCTYNNSNPCDDPFNPESSCTCQPVEQSGNSTGAHAHMSVYHKGVTIPLLACYSGV